MLLVRRRLLITVAALLPGALAGPCAVARDTWSRYDNRFFTVYSDASERATRNVLEDLEEFRAAFLQVGNIVVPPTAPKTLVILTRTVREFERFKIGKNVGGFAETWNHRTLIVMPVFGGDNASAVIRHEYGHALLRHKRYPYPAWYEEGFAEIASAIRLKRGGETFIVGAPTERAKFNGAPVFPWDELFSEDFAPHGLTDARLGSSAYAQAWLMAHWATLGGGGANARMLQAYFDRLRDGEPALAAFEAAFGFPPEDAWDARLKAYSRGFPAYTFRFAPGVVDKNFELRSVEDAEIAPMLRYLDRHAIALYRPEPPEDPHAALDGRWGELQLESADCGPALTLEVKGDTLDLELGDRGSSDPEQRASLRFHLTPRQAEPAAFNMEPADPDALGNSVPDAPATVSLRSADVACLSTHSSPGGCQSVLVRCAAGPGS